MRTATANCVEWPCVQSDTNEAIFLVTLMPFFVTSSQVCSSVLAPSQSPTSGQPLFWLPEAPGPLHCRLRGPAHASLAVATQPVTWWERAPGSQGVWVGQAQRPPRGPGLPPRKCPVPFTLASPSCGCKASTSRMVRLCCSRARRGMGSKRVTVGRLVYQTPRCLSTDLQPDTARGAPALPQESGSYTQHNRALLVSGVTVIEHVANDCGLGRDAGPGPRGGDAQVEHGFAAQELSDARPQDFAAVSLSEIKHRSPCRQAGVHPTPSFRQQVGGTEGILRAS